MSLLTQFLLVFQGLGVSVKWCIPLPRVLGQRMATQEDPPINEEEATEEEAVEEEAVEEATEPPRRSSQGFLAERSGADRVLLQLLQVLQRDRQHAAREVERQWSEEQLLDMEAMARREEWLRIRILLRLAGGQSPPSPPQEEEVEEAEEEWSDNGHPPVADDVAAVECGEAPDDTEGGGGEEEEKEEEDCTEEASSSTLRRRRHRLHFGHKEDATGAMEDAMGLEAEEAMEEEAVEEEDAELKSEEWTEKAEEAKERGSESRAAKRHCRRAALVRQWLESGDAK